MKHIREIENQTREKTTEYEKCKNTKHLEYINNIHKQKYKCRFSNKAYLIHLCQECFQPDSMWCFSDAEFAFTFSTYKYPSGGIAIQLSSFRGMCAAVHSAIGVKTGNKYRDWGEKTNWDQKLGMHKQKNRHQRRRPSIIRAAVPWQFCFSTVANTFIINVIVDAVIVRAMRWCARVDPSYTCHNRFSIHFSSHTASFVCQVFCWFYALTAKMLFERCTSEIRHFFVLFFYFSFPDTINAAS